MSLPYPLLNANSRLARLLPGLLLLAGLRPLAAGAQTALPNVGANSITLLQLSQPPCPVPTAKSVITAKLAYHLDEAEHSDYGFAVSIKFQGTERGMTFSMGREGEISISRQRDTLTLRYPMAAIVGSGRLRRPITCFFYLHRNTAPGRSTVLASTPPVVFWECE